MTGVNTYSTTPANNVNANTGINWDEGMAPAAVNNSARQNMTDIRLALNDLVWFQYGKGDLAGAPTYSSGTIFTQASSATLSAIYHVGRRVKAVGSSTVTIYGTISATAFAASTQTVTVLWDSGSLSNEALTIYLSQIPLTGSPMPDNSGTWTPVLFGTSTAGTVVGTNTGTYIKTGKIVFAFFNISTSSITSIAGNARISGLPFAAAVLGEVSISSYNGVTLGAGFTQLTGEVPIATGTQIELIVNGTGVNSADLPSTSMANATLLRGVAIYQTAS